MPLRAGQLIMTQVNDQWQSTKYWDTIEHEWVDIKTGSPCLVISVDLKKVLFISAGRTFSIHNCYDSADGIPVWCSKL